jgi:hypothetical protein
VPEVPSTTWVVTDGVLDIHRVGTIFSPGGAVFTVK